MSDIPEKDIIQKAKRYSRVNYILEITELFYLLAFLFLFQLLGFSKNLSGIICAVITNNYLAAVVYLFTVFIIYYLINLPLNFYHSFILEHRFNLSTQKLSAWVTDQLKSVLISYLIGVIALEAFYFILGKSPDFWWLIISLFWIFFNLVLAKIAPLVIIPLFFKCKKFSDDILRERIMNLADKMGVKIMDVFEIDFSKKTLKANAAFTGLGSTKRILLADTLKDKYNYDEIEVILAHEFAHYRLKHLLKLVLVNAAVSILCFYLIFKTSFYVLGFFGLSSLSDIAALPIIFIYFILFGIFMQPFGNSLSRYFEKKADLLAVKTTGLKEAFISTMNKLANQNLADRNPHPLIKFFFFDHPPIDERIALIRES